MLVTPINGLALTAIQCRQIPTGSPSLLLLLPQWLSAGHRLAFSAHRSPLAGRRFPNNSLPSHCRGCCPNG